MDLNWFDILLVLLIVINVALGWQRGFILSILDLVRWVASWLAALVFYRYVSNLLSTFTDWTEVWRAPIAFLIVLLLVSAAIHALGRRILKRIPREYHEHRANHVFGSLPGLASGLIIAAVVSALMFSMPVSDDFSETLRESRFADPLAAYTEDLETALAPVFEPAVRQTLNRLTTVEPGSKETVELPFKLENTSLLRRSRRRC